MTSFTPRSAMTSFTASCPGPVSLATEGARRATEAVKETRTRHSSQVVIVFINNHLVQGDFELLLGDIDGRNHVFVDGLRRQPEFLAKDVQQRLTTNKPYQVIVAALGLGQRVLWRRGRFRKTTLLLFGCQGHLRRAPLQLGVAVPGIMLLFKEQRFADQFGQIFHLHSPQEPPAVVVIELFDHAVAPRLSQRNEPGLHAIGQAKADQTTHASRMPMAAMKDHLVIYLLMFWHSQTPPVRPDSVDRRLRCFVQNRRHRAAPGRYVHAVHAVKTQRPTQVTGPDVVALMHFIGALADQLRIAFTLRFVASAAAVRQPFALHCPADAAQARPGRHLQGLQLPTNRLCTAEQSLVVEMQTRQLDRFHNFARQLPRVAMRSSGLLFLPRLLLATRLITLNPFVDPWPRVTELLGDCRDRIAFQVTLDRLFSVALLFLLHAFLPNEKGPHDETTALRPLKKLNFQRTVNDVMTLIS